MKSEKAKDILRDALNYGFTPADNGDWRDVKVGYVTAVQAVEQAEADVREKFKWAFVESCTFRNNYSGTYHSCNKHGSGLHCIPNACGLLMSFLQRYDNQ